MEEKIYPHVNDYVQYINSQQSLFKNPNQNLDLVSLTNYDRVVWPMFLDERYGHEINRFVWEAYRSGKTDFKEVFEESIGKKGFGRDIDSSMANFGQWLFCTGTRSGFKPGFRDATLWPTAPVELLKNVTILLKQITMEPHGFLFVKRNTDLEGVGFEPSYSTNPVGITLFAPPSPPDSISTTSLLFPALKSLISDTTSPFIIFSNGYSGQRSFTLYEKERFFVFDVGQVVNYSVSSNINASLTFLKSVVCTLEYENEEPYPPGRVLYEQLQTAGIAEYSDTIAPKSAYFSVVHMKTHSSIESLIDSNVVKIQFIPKATKVAGYRIDAINSSYQLIATSIRISNDKYVLDYLPFRNLLNKDSSGSRTITIAERWINTLVRATVFPSPAKLSIGKVFITSVSAGNSSELFLYTLSGKLVRRIPASCSGCSYNVSANGQEQIIFEWNLRNTEHAVVSPGIYLYAINEVSTDKSLKRVEKGKLAIVEK